MESLDGRGECYASERIQKELRPRVILTSFQAVKRLSKSQVSNDVDGIEVEPFIEIDWSLCLRSDSVFVQLLEPVAS